MRINGYRCDGCGKEHLLGPYTIPQDYGSHLPHSWYVVMPGGEQWQGKMVPWIFCSLDCLRHHPLTLPESMQGKSKGQEQ